MYRWIYKKSRVLIYIILYRTCPNHCGATITNMTARALINIYNELDIKCLKCPKTLKLGDLLKHE